MKPRIVVLGGGMGSMAAVWELSHRPEIQQRYDIVVYQQGWRLGGKAASGRNPDAHQRIEEHGLHVWMGFYQNAFRVVRECYTELTGDADAWKQYFVPHGHIALEQRWNGAWKHWHLDFPTRQQLVPGDAVETPSPWQYVRRMLWTMAHMADDSPYLQSLGMPSRLFTEKPTLLRVLRTQLDRVDLQLGRILPFNNGDKASDALGELFTRVLKLAVTLPEDAAPPDAEQQRVLVWLLDKLRQGLRATLGRLADAEFEAFQMLTLFDFGLTTIIGMINDGLLTPPYRFEAIDDLDFKAWLDKHALASTIDSAPVNALYDLVFSIYTGIAAGTTLICALRMLFSYSGAIFYKVRGGMGDVVFAPLYRALERRGVEFKFFHRVDALHLSPYGDRVDRIDLARQATLKSGRYEPLVDVAGLPSWPSAPDWSQLVEGDELRRGDEIPAFIPDTHGGYDLESPWTAWADRERLTLELGPRDLIVFGISLGGLPIVGKELVDANPRLAELVRGVPTAATQALQLWTDKSLTELGWSGPPPVSGSYEEPFDTYAEMDHLLDVEAWPAGERPRHIAYFCGYLEEPQPPPASSPSPFAGAERQRVRAQAVDWMNAHLHQLWPNAGRPGAFDFSVLHDPFGRKGSDRLEAQYYRANTAPSERYVLTTPGSTRFRLRADESGFANVVFAGDWLRTGINGGCIEAATMGGLQAARRISGYPERIVGDADGSAIVPMQNATTRFIERGGDVVLRPPYQQDGTMLYAFLLRTQVAALQGLADRYLNHGPVRYEAVAPFVALIFADIRRTYSTDPEDRKKGWMPERDVSFWVPLRVRGGTGGRFDSLRWFLPYIWVDNGIAMAAGREVFGFPKELGELVIPKQPKEANAFSVATDVLDEFGEDEPVRRRRIIEVTRAGTGSPSLWQMARDKLSDASGALFKAAGLDQLGLTSWPRFELTRMVFLKRFRDISDGALACYQSVVEASARPTQIRGGGMLDSDFVVRLDAAASHPFVAELFGAAEGRTATLKPFTAFWVDFDFAMELGHEIWRSTSPSHGLTLR